MKKNKYNYTKVIQFGYNGQWSDESEYATDSRGNFATKDERDTFKHDLREYQIAYAGMGGRIRSIFRRQLIA